jgi:hypothetical protein
MRFFNETLAYTVIGLGVRNPDLPGSYIREGFGLFSILAWSAVL